MADLKLEIAQERPFSSLEEEALLNLMRTADCVNRAFHLQVRTWGVTSTQYNVLRILRGAHPAALTCSEIGLRMIATDPDITRLLGRLKALKLIRQNRDRHDRRIVLTRISEAGLELLKQMDPVVQSLPIEMLGNFSKEELAELIRLLELGRRFSLGNAESCPPDGEPNGHRSSLRPVSCDGAKA
jgi:DNA-binding MarR family transcriptional regulator